MSGNRPTRRLGTCLIIASAVVPVGCGYDEVVNPVGDATEPPYVPPPESCDPLDATDPFAFQSCSLGSGIFGTWVLDERGIPAYFYGLDQHADDRALYFNTEGLERRDHWFAFGNHRVNAMFQNDGFVEVVTQDRGVTYLNKVDPDQLAFGGGFSYIDDGTDTWSSAYRFRPKGSEVTRTVGVGYAQTATRHRDITVSRTLCSPPGNAAMVIDDVIVQNDGSETKNLRHYEYWDVGRRPIDINWAVSGQPLTLAPSTAREIRDGRNAIFEETPTYDAALKQFGILRTHAPGLAPPDATVPDPVDHYPPDAWLAVLTGEVAAVYVDKTAFFGAGGGAAPDAVTARAPGDTTVARVNALGQPHLLVARSDLSLAPGEQKHLRFAYGYAPMGEPFALEGPWADPAIDVCAMATDAIMGHTMTFATARAPVLRRELAWHAAQIEVSVGQRDYWEGPVVPQGSAYLYLHGADGAARDLGLFAVPLVYTHPALAKAELQLYMGITHADGRRFSYAFQGHGMLDDALGLHNAPSDLTLFFLWAMSEYLGATGDLALLDEPAPFYPRDAVPGAVGWDHVHDAVRHLFDVVGVGEHGLVRVQTGDWSDGIVIEAPDRAWAIANGESVPNTQMAVAILPRVADIVEPRDPALAEEIRTRVAAYRDAVAGAWTGSFFGRAYLEPGKLADADRINLEAQVWALIGDTFSSAADRQTLVDEVQEKLVEPSPSGAQLLADGQVWPAISGLLTWGYARSHPELAWAHFIDNTMAAHASAYPEIWFGIWSGPDGLNGPTGERPGGSWFSQVTPMTDFPVQNNNQHAMPLLAAIRMAGIDATATGLRIAPPTPFEPLTLRTELIDLEIASEADGFRMVVRYRAPGEAPRDVRIALPDAKISRASAAGRPLTIDDRTGELVADATIGGGALEIVYVEK